MLPRYEDTVLCSRGVLENASRNNNNIDGQEARLRRYVCSMRPALPAFFTTAGRLQVFFRQL